MLDAARIPRIADLIPAETQRKTAFRGAAWLSDLHCVRFATLETSKRRKDLSDGPPWNSVFGRVAAGTLLAHLLLVF
jgi:hypothetical protein